MNNKQNTLPSSVTNIWISLVGLLSFLASLEVIRRYQVENFHAAIIGMVALALPIIILERIFIQKHRLPSTGLSANIRNKISIKRVATKLLGLYGTFGLIAFLYWLFPEYKGDFYDSYWRLLQWGLSGAVVLSIPYFFWMDSKEKDPEDDYYNAGLFFLIRWKQTDFKLLGNYARGWLVKLFFLPFMFIYLNGNMGPIKDNSFVEIIELGDFTKFYDYLYNLLFTIDLAYVCVGYALTLKILDNHIRSTDSTFFGWGIALFCYQPFWGLIGGTYLRYDNGFFWGQILADNEVLYVLCGSLILLLVAIYVWASISFGLRFSNLTNRGIITNGPYKWMRHPAYVSKNISWWLISAPFINEAGPTEAIRLCLLLLGLNLIYFFRARTEERHLAQDKDYVAYAQWINENGLFSKLFKVIPLLKFKEVETSNSARL